MRRRWPGESDPLAHSLQTVALRFDAGFAYNRKCMANPSRNRAQLMKLEGAGVVIPCFGCDLWGKEKEVFLNCPMYSVNQVGGGYSAKILPCSLFWNERLAGKTGVYGA